MRHIFLTVLTLITFFTQLHAQGFSWAQGYLSTGGAGIVQIAFDGNNNSYSLCSFSGTIDVDQSATVHNITAVGQTAMVLLKQDAAGNFLWARELQCKSNTGSGVAGSVKIYVDSVDNIYLAGRFLDTVDFDPGPNTFYLGAPVGTMTAYNGFVMKVDSNGSLIWAKKIGGASINDQAFFSDIIVHGSYIYLTGGYLGTVDLDPGSASASFTTGGQFLEKLDTAGNYSWAKKMAGYAFYLAKDSAANLYAVGGVPPGTTTDFDPGPGVANVTSFGGNDIFIQKFDSAANHIWVKHIGSGGSDVPNGIAVDRFGNVFVTGYYDVGTVDFDPGPGVYNITAISRDMFVLRLRNNGDFSWAISIHPGGNDVGRAITSDNQGNVYTTGESIGGADFDPGPGQYSLGGGVYVQKLDSAGNFKWGRSWEADVPAWIGLDNSNNIYITGWYSGSTDFDPGPGVFTIIGGFSSGFIEKLCGSALSLTGSDTVICSGTSVQLSTPAITGATYAWRKDGSSITGSSNIINVSQAGWYEVYVNGVGCPSASDPIYLSVVSTLIPTINISGPVGELVGQPVTINANVANAGPSYSINWKNNGVSFATTTVPSVTYTKQAGSDIITAFVTSTFPGCYDSTLSNTHSVYDATGIAETLKAIGIEVYPNPFEDMLTVKGLKTNDKLVLADITGRVIYTWLASQQIQTFSINDLAPGHYILKIANGDGKLRVNVPVVKK